MAGIKVSAAQEAIEGKKSRHLVRAAALSHAGYSPGCHRNLSLFSLAASLPPFSKGEAKFTASLLQRVHQVLWRDGIETAISRGHTVLLLLYT